MYLFFFVSHLLNWDISSHFLLPSDGYLYHRLPGSQAFLQTKAELPWQVVRILSLQNRLSQSLIINLLLSISPVGFLWRTLTTTDPESLNTIPFWLNQMGFSYLQPKQSLMVGSREGKTIFQFS